MNKKNRVASNRASLFIKWIRGISADIASKIILTAKEWSKQNAANDKKTILLVDDEVDLTELVEFQLTAKGYNVIVAHNGIEALKVLNKTSPDLIILDVNMPGMGGLEFYNKISAAHGGAKYPTLVVTARTNLEGIFKDIETEGFMTKPFEIDSLIREVDRITSDMVNPMIFLVDFKEKPNVVQMIEAFNKGRYDVINVEDYRTLRSKAEEKKPDFIILEYMQREMAGDKFIKTIKADSLLSGIPIIVYSYTGFEECEEKSLSAGADKYLGKPESCEDLLKAIKELKMNRRNNS